MIVKGTLTAGPGLGQSAVLAWVVTLSRDALPLSTDSVRFPLAGIAGKSSRQLASLCLVAADPGWADGPVLLGSSSIREGPFCDITMRLLIFG